MNEILTSDPPSLRSARSGLDRSLEVLAMKCLEKDPARRFDSAEELADELARWQRGEPIKTRPLPLPLRMWRKVRKRPFVTSLAVLCVVCAMAAAVVYVRDPFRDIEAKQRRLLAQGLPVTLISEDGHPVWFRSAFGNPQISKDAEPFAVYSWKMSLVELMPAPLPKSYRLSADVRHNSGSYSGKAGIYFAHAQQQIEQGPMYSLCLLAFNDVKVTADETKHLRKHEIKDNQIGLFLRIFWDGPGKLSGVFDRNIGGTRAFPPARQLPESQPWRHLAVEVGKDAIRAAWDGVPIGWPFPLASISLETDKLHKNTKLDPATLLPLFSMQHACGVYVHQGSASFKNVVIEPLQP